MVFSQSLGHLREWILVMRRRASGRSGAASSCAGRDWIRSVCSASGGPNEECGTTTSKRCAGVASRLRSDNYEAALALAEYPESIKGFGPVKEQSIRATRERTEVLRGEFAASDATSLALCPTLYRDGSRRPTLSQNKWDNSYPYYERDRELLGQQTGQFLGRF